MAPCPNGVEVGLSDDIDAVREETLDYNHYVSCNDVEKTATDRSPDVFLERCASCSPNMYLTVKESYSDQLLGENGGVWREGLEVLCSS